MFRVRARDSCDPKTPSPLHQTHHSCFHTTSFYLSDGLRSVRRPRSPPERLAEPHQTFLQSSSLTTNTARTELSIAPLTGDSKLAKDAQQYANQLASTDSGMHHSNQLSQQRQGENLASCPGPWPNPYRESSKLWYAEKKNWKGGVFQAQDTQAVGHYTQVSGRHDEETVAAQQTDT